MKPGSSTSASSRSRGTTPSTPTGSCTEASHASGSTHLNTSRVWASHDQRRFIASSSSAASSGGSDGRTVKLRRAFIPADATQPARRTGARATSDGNAAFTPRGYVPGPWHTRSGASSPERSSSPSPSRRSSSPIPGPGEALVQVQACGVCHTDLHYREGGINDDFPFLLGHEAAGRGGGRRRRRGRRGARRLRDPQLASRVRRVPLVPPRASLVLLLHPQRHAEDDARRRRSCRRRSASAPSPRRRSWRPASAPRSPPT